ncbi:MAG: hypothetical protein EPO68_18190 [Planctomycetota bacterium]|nr:MAG: hypothetical protein EPO68_18190 [Planctomycetota bacterium]
MNRGRGDAEISWGDETPEHAAEMEQQALPAADAMDLDRLELLSQGLGAPRADAQGEAAGNAGQQASAGAPVWKRSLAPRHRRAVETYFGAAPTPAPDAPASGGAERR